MASLMTLGELLRAAPALPWGGWLYVASQPRPATLGSLCAVIDRDAESDPDRPALAVEHGLECVLDMGAVKQVVSNAQQQLQQRRVPLDVLHRALGYYHRHDAFLDLRADRA
jgi:hypothetical protein